MSIAAVRQYSQLYIEQGQAQGVQPSMLAGLTEIESGGNPGATSYAGAMGLMQVMPFHFAAGENPYDPATNVRVGTRVLRAVYDRCGEWDKALAGYFGALSSNCQIMTWTDGSNVDGFEYVRLARVAQQNYVDLDSGSSNGGSGSSSNDFPIIDNPTVVVQQIVPYLVLGGMLGIVVAMT